MIIDPNNESNYFPVLYSAGSFLQRFKGLLFTNSLKTEEALLIYKCNSVHTFAMRFPIDLLYLDKEHRIVKIVENVQPWRTSYCFAAASVLEAASGACKRHSFKVGQQIVRNKNTTMTE